MSDPKPNPIPDREYYTAMSHFYRGELTRIMSWRQRLDATTNWAIFAATGVLTFAMGHPEISHLVFMVANLMVFLLLTIEGRRYRYYDAYRARVRMLETHFLLPVVMRHLELLEGNWRNLLAEDLLLPSFKISIWEAIARRLNRNYIWIFLILLGSWIVKISMHSPAINSLGDFFLYTQKTQPLHPFLFWTLFLFFYGVLTVLVIYGRRCRLDFGDVQRPLPGRESWQI